MSYTLLPLEPDWSEAVQVEREYKTDITISRDLTEQRKAMRQQPRRAFEFSSQVSPKDARDLLSLIDSKLQSLFAIPDFTRETVLSAGSLEATSTISFSGTVPAWVKAGARIVLGQGRYSAKELVEVSSLAGGVATLTALLGRAWPAGSKVRPAVLGTLDQQVKFSLATIRSGRVKFRFNEDPGTSDEPYRSPSLLFEGREVWLEKPNWRDAVDHSVEGQLATLDFGIGVVSHAAFQDFNVRQFQSTYSMFDKESAESFIEFLHRKRGRQHPFWMPTWRNDLQIAEPAASGSSELVVLGEDPFLLYGESVSMNRIALFMRSGAIHLFSVQSMEVVSGNTVLSLAQTLPENVEPSSVQKISWMPLWRFAADTVVLNWMTNSVCETKLSLMQLRSDFDTDGLFPISEIVADGSVASATRTYSLVSLPFISTTSEKGEVLFNWSVFARSILTGLGTSATLQVTTRFFLDSAGSPGAQIGSSIVDSVSASGLVSLAIRKAIPASAGHVRFILSRVAADPVDTVFELPVNTIEIRGRP